MRIVIIEFMSLDGVVQAPGGPDEDTDGGFTHGGWTHPFFDPEVVGGAFAGALGNADALLFGRRTWQTMAAAWPDRAGDPFADQMNSIAKHVVSSTLTDDELTWNNTTLIPGDEAVARIRELRGADGGDLVVMGSPTLARTLLHEGLVDELRLILMPVLLGGGKTHLPGGRRDAYARARLGGHERRGRAGVHLQAGRRDVARRSLRPREADPSTAASLSAAARTGHRPAPRASPPPRSRRTRRELRDGVEELLVRRPRADHQDRARPIAGPDEDVLRAGRAVDEVPLAHGPLLALDEQLALSEQHEEPLLLRLGVVEAVRLARHEHADVDPDLLEPRVAAVEDAAGAEVVRVQPGGVAHVDDEPAFLGGCEAGA